MSRLMAVLLSNYVTLVQWGYNTDTGFRIDVILFMAIHVFARIVSVFLSTSFQLCVFSVVVVSIFAIFGFTSFNAELGSQGNVRISSYLLCIRGSLNENLVIARFLLFPLSFNFHYCIICLNS